MVSAPSPSASAIAIPVSAMRSRLSVGLGPRVGCTRPSHRKSIVTWYSTRSLSFVEKLFLRYTIVTVSVGYCFFGGLAMKSSTVLISGASIAGPALAHWLGRYGFPPTVGELASALRSGGTRVDVPGH